VIRDTDVRLLASLAATLEEENITAEERRMWEGSPFYWIKSRPSRTVGKIGEQLVSAWAAAKGFDVTRPVNSGHDRIIGGLKIEIKFSTLWTDSRIFKFQQLRDQDYEYAFLLGVSPYDAQAWLVPKFELSSDRPPHLIPQHGGSAGHDTRWLSFPAEKPPRWIEQFGGTLAAVDKLLTSIIGRKE